MRSSIALVLPLLAFASGCAPYKYHPAPIAPPALAAGLEARNLDDPGLRAWMSQAAAFEPPAWPMTAWDLNKLTLAAYYFNTDMDVARANAAVADAAIKTAAMKPNPSVGADAGYRNCARRVLTCWDSISPSQSRPRANAAIASPRRHI